MPKPTWQIVMRVIISIICVIAFALGALSFKAGAFFNYMLIVLMLAVPLVLVARLPYAIKKQIDWRFLTHPFSADSRARWKQILPRILFWIGCATFVQIGVISAQLQKEELITIYGICWGAASLLILISLFPKKVGAKPMSIFSIAALIPMSFFLIDSLYPQLSGKGAISVHSPFSGESYMFHAGHNEVVNYHVAHTSQKHAVDVVLTHANGKEVNGSRDVLEDYACYGAPLIAPVMGEVVGLVSGLPDQEIGTTNGKHPAGNHVVIKIDETHYAMLAHMKKDSAVVAIGDQVNIGDALGQCGNSGNTSGPHLHFQVQRYPDLFAEGGFTYPIKFDGTSRIRGGKTTTKDGLFYRRNDRMVPLKK